MFNEYDYLGRLEMAGAADFSQMLLSPSQDEERTLRKYLGNRRYQRMHSLAVRCEMNRSARNAHRRGNVIFVPGMLGSQLTSEDMNGAREHIWLNPRHIIAGHMARLQLDETGRAEADPNYKISATGVLKRYYGEIILSLAEQWNVQVFPYDWRKDLKIAAAELHAAMKSFPDDEPVHIVAHSSGGLVARWFIEQFPQRWTPVTDGKSQPVKPEARLVMLATPNQGLYTAVLALVGQLALVHWADMLDAQHDHESFRAVVSSFPSVYQLLPAPTLVKRSLREKLYEVETYGDEAHVSPVHLAQARQDHAMLADAAIDPARMAYIAGSNQPTYVDISRPSGLQKLAAEYDPFEFFTKEHKLTPISQQTSEYTSTIHKVFTLGSAGDGSAAHALALLPTVPTLYADDSHAGLVSNAGVLQVVQELLSSRVPWSEAHVHRLGKAYGLAAAPSGTHENHLSPERAQVMLEESWRRDRQQLDKVVRRVHFRSNRPLEQRNFSEEEQALRDTLARGFLYGRNRREGALPFAIPVQTPEITIHVHCGDLLTIDQAALHSDIPIDALALGHYVGSRPHGLLHQLDQVISQHQLGQGAQHTMPLREDQLLLEQYTQRGIIRGELAQPFFLRDPRPLPEGHPERTIAIAGMGTPGRFNEPELMVLVRELCWSVGRMGKRHLVTLLIGTGRENLPVDAAVSGWIRGIKHALTGAQYPLEAITFVIQNPEKVVAFDKALRHEKALLAKKDRMRIVYDTAECNHQELREIDRFRKLKRLQHQNIEDSANHGDGSNTALTLASTRIAVSLTGSKYRFGAITNSASIPEREIHLDPKLVNEANAELAIEGDPRRQVELGQFMEKLLIPEDLRGPLYSNAPLVMMVDAATARIHWELLAHAEPIKRSVQGVNGNLAAAIDADDLAYQFWGTCRGFTRQLRTNFAPPPEPPPPVERMLRVLVVADPAEDAPLIGAQEEGIYVADLFEQFNTLYYNTKNRIEVVRLFGPREATRTSVLRHLMQRTYDVLHFCGHSFFNVDDPAGSGWLFSDGDLLSAYEFTRIDRIPKFVFSNSCESGITPDRVGQHAQELAPSLAEAFFARGVSNFVCTAWPIDDRAARDFAMTLYAGLLGIGTVEGGMLENPESYRATTPLPMHEAMRAARLAVALPANDVRTWGAYQHYGNPYFRLFQPMEDGQTTLPLSHDYRRSQSATSHPAISYQNGATDGILSMKPAMQPEPDQVPNASADDDLADNIGEDELFHFYGIDGTTGEAVPPVSLFSLADLMDRSGGAMELATRLPNLRAKDPTLSELMSKIDDLAVAGWGIIYHKDEDPDVLAALRPLIEHRSNQIDNPKLIHELVYEGERSASKWLERQGLMPSDFVPEKVPFYLLLIGSPERIPFAFGHQLDLLYAVGRLHFETAAEYASYARSVVDYETGPVHNRKEMVLFAAEDPDDAAITASFNQLITPFVYGEVAGEQNIAEADNFHLQTFVGAQATKGALTKLFMPGDHTVEPPAFFFSSTHGVEWPLDDPHQHAAQGALFCGRSGHAGPLSTSDYFAAADLTDDANVHGLIAFFFACFGGGTPTHDRYLDGKKLVQSLTSGPERLSNTPFIAQLPKRLLAHPKGGALACISHVDRVFATSFANRFREPRPVAIRAGIREILTGKPVGLALTTFNYRFALTSAEISGQFEWGQEPDLRTMVTEWLIRNEAEGYILLGDPAVRLRLDQLQTV